MGFTLMAIALFSEHSNLVTSSIWERETVNLFLGSYLKRRMKSLQKTPNFFKRNERYIVWWFGTLTFCSVLMLISTRIYKLKLPVVAWRLFIENIGVLGLLISAISLWWTASSDKRQSEKKAQIEQLARIESKLEEYYSMLLSQQEVDKSLQQQTLQQQKRIDELITQVGRLAAQVAQFESSAHIRRRLDATEELLKKVLPSN